MQEMYTEKYKTWLREIKQYLNKCDWRTIIVKMPILPQINLQIPYNPYQNPSRVFIETDTLIIKPV